MTSSCVPAKLHSHENVSFLRWCMRITNSCLVPVLIYLYQKKMSQSCVFRILFARMLRTQKNSPERTRCFIWKETCVNGKRPKYITQTENVCFSKSRPADFTTKQLWKIYASSRSTSSAKTGLFSCRKRPMYMERDLRVWKQTCWYHRRRALTQRVSWEVGGWGRDPKKCTGRDWGMGSSTI